MKLSELKHNHSLTDLLKILLFAILMLAPIGMVATRCLYVIANKNAYQSYSGEQLEYEYSPVNNVDELELHNYYSFNSALIELPSSNYIVSNNTKVENIQNVNSSSAFNINIENINYFTCYIYASGTKTIEFSDSSLATLGTYNATNSNISFEFELLSYNNNIVNILPALQQFDVNNYSNLDNVFEYSVSQLEESTLFNWTQNTAIYSGVETMTTQLGITNQTIPILLVYWFLLTVIYVIIDIILKLFTYMTHAIGSRKV